MPGPFAFLHHRRGKLPGMRLLFALALLHALPAQAQQQPFACTQALEDFEICIADKLCQCRQESGGTLTGRRPGMRWDCGILRPSCGVVPAGPPAAAISVYPQARGRNPAWNQQIIE